jgi:ACS family glucarate transporter-like MFS transporter
MMRDLGLTPEQMSLVFSAFALAYAIFDIPTGRWADRHGTRRVLTRIVAWWSAFTMLTAVATGFISLLVLRFLFGAGEAGAWPCVARTYSRWLPPSQRGRVQGLFFAGALLAGALTPLLVLTLTRVMSWRAIFVMFGLIGFVWAAAWYRWFRDEPSDHRGVNAEERALIGGPDTGSTSAAEGRGPWRQLLTHRNTVALCLMYFPNSFVFYFCITWLPKYFEEKLGFDTLQLGLFSGLPLACGVVGVLLGGMATDAASRRFGLRLGRSGLGVIGYLGAAGALLLATVVDQPVVAAITFASALAASMFTLSAAWSTCLDIGGNHAGVVSAAMNTSGQIGSILCPLVAVQVRNACGDWNPFLLLMAAMFMGGAVCWALIDPTRKLTP